MPLKTWKKIRQDFEIRNPWWTYRKDTVLFPSGKSGEYHFVHVKGSSMIIPVAEDGTLILVNQYRYLADRESLEFPCGSVPVDSTFDESARRELMEETGFDAGSIQPVGEFNPYNGVTDEFCRVFVAQDLRPVNVGHDESEEFEQVRLTPREVDEMIRSGRIWDGMSLAAWARARHRFLA